MIDGTESLMELSLLAQLMGIPLTTLREWIDAGLAHECWNGKVLTNRAAVNRFLQGHESAQRQVA